MGNSVSFIASPLAPSYWRLCAQLRHIPAPGVDLRARSAGIEELVDEHGVTPKFE